MIKKDGADMQLSLRAAGYLCPKCSRVQVLAQIRNASMAMLHICANCGWSRPYVLVYICA